MSRLPTRSRWTLASCVASMVVALLVIRGHGIGGAQDAPAQAAPRGASATVPVTPQDHAIEPPSAADDPAFVESLAQALKKSDGITLAIGHRNILFPMLPSADATVMAQQILRAIGEDERIKLIMTRDGLLIRTPQQDFERPDLRDANRITIAIIEALAKSTGDAQEIPWAEKTKATDAAGGAMEMMYGTSGPPQNSSSSMGGPSATGQSRQQADHERIRAARRKMMGATTDDERQATRAELRQLLAEIFAEDMQMREKQAAEIESRLARLRQQYQAREKVKNEIIDLQLKVIEQDAAGLGFPGGPSSDTTMPAQNHTGNPYATSGSFGSMMPGMGRQHAAAGSLGPDAADGDDKRFTQDAERKPDKHYLTNLRRLAAALENFDYPENAPTTITVWCQGGGKGTSVQVKDDATLDLATACHLIVDGHYNKDGLDLANVAVQSADRAAIRFVNIKEKFFAGEPAGVNVTRGELVAILERGPDKTIGRVGPDITPQAGAGGEGTSVTPLPGSSGAPLPGSDKSLPETVPAPPTRENPESSSTSPAANATRSNPLVLVGHTDWVTGVAFGPDGKRVASSSRDGTIKVWDSVTGQELLTLKRSDPKLNDGHAGYVQAVAFSPDGLHLASAGGGDKAAYVWNASTGRAQCGLFTHTSGVMSVTYNPDGSRLATASSDNTVKVWDANPEMHRGGEILSLEHPMALSVSFSPDGKRLASSGRDGAIRVWNAVTGELLLTIKGDGQITCVTFSPDGQRLTSSGPSVQMWDATTGKMLFALKELTGLGGATFSPDGTRLATSGGDRLVRLWDATTGQKLLTLKPITKSFMHSVDATTVQKLLTLKGHGNSIGGLSFSPDGQRLASASQDHTVRVWDLTPASEDRGK